MKELNLPKYLFNIKEEDGKKYIFDQVRKKYILLTPEEWVRQNFIEYLVQELGYPRGLIAVEMSIKLNKNNFRCDIVLHNTEAKPTIIVECKATTVNINQNVFDQIARYNMPIKVDYLIVTNGLSHYCCKMDYINEKYTFEKNIPKYIP